MFFYELGGAIGSRLRAAWIVGGALLAIAVGASSPAAAQSIRLDNYRMAETPEDGFAVSRPNGFGHLRFGARLDLDYALNPLVYQLRGSDSDTEVAAVVEHLFAAQLGLSFGIVDRIVIFAGLPVNLVLDGQQVEGQPRADGTSLGDVYLGVRGRIFGEPTDAFAISLQLTGTAPTAQAARFQSRFAGEGSFTLEPELLMEFRFGDVVRLTLNTGFRIRERQNFGLLEVRSEWTWAGGFYAWLVKDVLDLAVETYGSTSLFDFGEGQLTPIEAIAGLRVQPVRGLFLGLAGGTALQRGYGAPDFRGVLSVSYATEGDSGPHDRDGDGIEDGDDRCPDEAEDADGFEDEDGCPDPDNDGDGIEDATDQCPTQPEDRDGLQDDDGCPEDDADGDGVRDQDDRCPNEAGRTDWPRPECNGCPTCADDAPPPVTPQGETELPHRVYFEVGRDELRPGEQPALENVQAYLEAHPEAEVVVVMGHADYRGAEPFNLELSQQRARRVRGWLESHGVPRGRIRLVGCGETYPAEPNETREGRQANRRVEFWIVGGGSPSLRAGCVEVN